MNTPPGEQLLNLTREMLASAQASDWERLAELEQTRLPLFHQVFDQGIVGNEELAREVLVLDEKSMELARARLPVIQRELLMMRNSGKANSAYQSIQNSTSGDS